MEINEHNLKVGQEYVFRGSKAITRKERRKGLSGINFNQAPSEMIFENCRSIHTFKMKFNLLVVFLDKDNHVLGSRTINPNRIVVGPRKTYSIVEIPIL